MKKVSKSGLIWVVFAALFSGCASSNFIAETPVVGTITYQAFYDNLSPYGTWIDYPGYGNVWNPRIEAGFRPYATNGHWIYSNEGWAWESNYNWGWAPFHYGRWMYDDMYGWLWLPGYDWSPAWVTWGSVNNYYAWAPLMPEVNVGAQYGNWRPHAYYWNVCDRNHIYDRNLSNVIIKNEQNKSITNNITIINNYNTSRGKNYYSRGPEVRDVEKYTNRKIEPVSFKDQEQLRKTKQQGNTVNVFRPVIQNSPAADTKREEDRQENPVNRINQGVPMKENRINNQPSQNPQPGDTKNQSFTKVNPIRTPGQDHPANQNNNINQQQYPAPQPRVFRKAAPDQIRPIHNFDQSPSIQRNEQRKNIDQLPVQKPLGNINTGSNRNNHKKNE